MRTIIAPSRRLAMLIGESAAIVAIRDLVDRVAASDVPVLITGPSGSGKGTVAELLHQRGSRAAYPFVAMNCASVPRDRLESELFGDETGSFTGATRAQCGFELADGGTLFLDTVGDTTLDFQAELLRILKTRCIGPLGGGREGPPGVRVIAATDVDLPAAIAGDRFRADLFDHLAAVEISMPALAERRGDIPILIDHFVAIEAERGPVPHFTDRALAYLARQPWPGNVRELRNFVARATAIHPGVEIDDDVAAVLLHGERRKVDRWLASASEPLALPNRRRPSPFVAAGEVVDLEALLTDFEQAYIRDALGRTAFGAADPPRMLGLRKTTLIEQMRRLTITRPHGGPPAA